MKLITTSLLGLLLLTSSYMAQANEAKARCARGDCRPNRGQDRRPDVRPDRRPDVRPDRRPDVRPDRRPDVRPDRRPDVRPDRRPDVRPDRRPDIRPDRRPDFRPVPNRPIRRPRPVVRHHRVRYQTPRDYIRVVPRTYVYRDRWVRWNDSRIDGIYWENDYPVYTYRGFRYRYSPVEMCDYELVDEYTGQVFERFYGMSCQDSYDYCADLRDDLNFSEYADRYFCAETWSSY